MKTIFFTVLFSATAGLLAAQPVLSFDRILLTIATPNIPGAFGSLWSVDAVVHNGDSVTRAFDVDPYCVFPEGCPTAIPPGQTGHILFRGEPAENPGLVMFVEHPSDRVAFESRIQDLSRQAQTWGT